MHSGQSEGDLTAAEMVDVDFAMARATASTGPLGRGYCAVRVALAIRFALGRVPGGSLYLTFYPTLLIATIFLGWQEAGFVLVLSLAVGWYFFLPRDMTVFLAGAGVVGTLNIAIVTALKALAAVFPQ
jgi:hypothetical protein